MKSRRNKWISMVMTLCMVLSMLPGISLTALAADEHTDHTEWTATGGYYLSSHGSFGEDTTIPAGETVTLCLNGKRLQSENYNIKVYGTLNICDCKNSGQIRLGDGYIIVMENGTLTVNSGTITSTAASANADAYSATIDNSGTTVINGGTIQNTNDDPDKYGCAIRNNDKGSLTVNGGTIQNVYKDKAIVAEYGTTTTITGGAIKAADYAVDMYGTLFLSGAPEFNGDDADKTDITLIKEDGKIAKLYMTETADAASDKYKGSPLKMSLPDFELGDVVAYHTTDLDLFATDWETLGIDTKNDCIVIDDVLITIKNEKKIMGTAAAIDDVLGDGTVSYQPASGNVNDGYYGLAVLTLNNADISFEDEFENEFIIDITVPCVIEFKGDNRLINYRTYAINSYNTLYLKGTQASDSLTLESEVGTALYVDKLYTEGKGSIFVTGYCGIEADSSVNFSGCDITVKGTGDEEYSYAIQTFDSDSEFVVSEGANLYATGEYYAIGTEETQLASTLEVSGSADFEATELGSVVYDSSEKIFVTGDDEFAKTVKITSPAPAHTHNADGTAGAGVTYDTEWTGSVAQNISDDRNIVLTGDVTLGSNKTTFGNGTDEITVNLCLNGNTLDVDWRIIEIADNTTLNICDCGTTKGQITGGGDTDPAITVKNGGELNLYGVALELKDAAGMGNPITDPVVNYGELNVFGGSMREGIYNGDGGMLTVTDGSMKDIHNAGTLTLKGSLTLNEEKYIYMENANAVLNGTDYTGETVKVHLNGASFTEGSVVVTGGKDKLDRFEVLNDGYTLCAGKDTNDLVLHQHSYQYAVGQDTPNIIMETCSCGHNAAAAIKAPDGTLIYDGISEFNAAVVYDVDWKGGKLLIHYTRDGSAADDTRDAGSYVASITKENAAAKVEYTVTKSDFSGGYIIDYTKETINIMDGYEVYTAQTDGTRVENGGTVTPGVTYYIRKAAASGWTEIVVAGRPSAPAGSLFTQKNESLLDRKDASLGGVSSTYEYKLGDGSWTTGEGKTIANPENKDISIRVKATGTAPCGEVLILTFPASAAKLSVAFNANNGQGTMAAQEFGHNGGKLDTNIFTYANYQFVGWNTVANGSGTSYADGAFYKPGTTNVTLYAQWSRTAYEVSGTITGAESTTYDGTPIATLTALDGRSYVAAVNGDGPWTYKVNAPAGIYQLVVTAIVGDKTVTVTSAVDLTADVKDENLVLPSGEKNSEVVITTEETPNVIVDGLDVLAKTDTTDTTNNTLHGTTVKVEVKLTVTKEDEAVAEGASEIKEKAPEKTFEFVDMTLTKSVNDTLVGDIGDKNTVLLSIVIPFDTSNKQNITAYRYHGGTATALHEDMPDAEGEYFTVDTGFITVYAKKFSTYAIGYTMASASIPPSNGGSSSKYFDISVEDTQNGDVDVSQSRSKANEEIKITVKPNEGYKLDKLTVETASGKKVDVEKGKTDGTFVFDMPKADVMVKTIFIKADAAVEKEDTPVVETQKIILTINSTTAWVFDEYIVNDVAPVIRNERTMLPIRFVAEALGATVDWNEPERKVTITKGDTIIESYVDQPFALVNAEPVRLDAAVFIENNRTYLPLRFVAENLGATVTWNEMTKTVVIVPNEA